MDVAKKGNEINCDYVTGQKLVASGSKNYALTFDCSQFVKNSDDHAEEHNPLQHLSLNS